MKAISLWQPWASALFTASLKPDETRHWEMPARRAGQEIAIHAALRATKAERAFWEEMADTSDIEQFKAIGIHRFEDLPRGVIIGTMTFGPSLKTQDVRQTRDLYQRDWGDYSDDRFAWPHLKRQLFPKPIPCVGRQGFFDWNNPLP